MPNQAWLDTLNASVLQQGTTEARLDGVSALALQQGTSESRLDGVTAFAMWSAVPPLAIVPDIAGNVGALATFDGSASQNVLSYVWSVVSVPGGSTTSFPLQILPDNGVDGIIPMASNVALYHCQESAGATVGVDTSGSSNNVTLFSVVPGTVAGPDAGSFAWDTTAGFPQGGT